MSEPKRGFGVERHAGVKAGIAVLAVGGFALTWAALGRSHEPAELNGGESVLSATTFATETATATASVTGTATGEPTATPTRVRRSRAS